MANKPFEIQSQSLSIGGVTLDTSVNGKLVIPGITRASSSVAIGIEDTADQTIIWPDVPDVIDGYTYEVYVTGNQSGLVGWTPATYAVDAIDGEGYIDGISVVSGGAGYTGEAVTLSNIMYAAPSGTPVDNSSNNGTWQRIPFRVRCGAGDIESEFSNGSGIGNLTMDTPWLILSQDSTNFIDFANAGQMRLAGGEGNQVQIISNYGTANTQHWNFNPDGTMGFPDGTQQVTAYDPQVVPGLNNHKQNQSSGDNTTTIKVVVPAQSVVVLALAAENANGQSINAVNVFGAGFNWQLRTRYTDPDSPVHQTGELWYAVNDGNSTQAGIVTIVYENDYDDQTSTYAVFGQVDLNNPWTQSGSFSGSTIDGGNYPTLTYSTQETNTIALAFIATSVSTTRTKPVGFTMIEDVSNGGAEYWEYSTLSYKINDTVQTDTVLTGEDTIELVPNGETSARGYTFIVDALRLTAPIGSSVSSLTNNGYTVSLDSNGVIHLPTGGDILDSNGNSVINTQVFTAPLPNWLTVVANTNHFPVVNTDYGFDSTGVWTLNATIGGGVEGTSYPFRTTFTIPSYLKTVTIVDFIVNDEGADFGIGVFATGTDPVWQWDGTNGDNQANRIGAQYNGNVPELHGISGGAVDGGFSLPGLGTYRARLTVLPVDPGVAEITLETLDTSDNVLGTITYTENSFFQTNYKIGFASDQDNAVTKTYFKNLTINVADGMALYTDVLTGYNSTLTSSGGSGTGAQLVGDGYVQGTGSKVTVYSDYQGYQGGEGTGIILPKSQIGNFTTGDTITFRNGEVRTISAVDTGFGDNSWVQWADEVVGNTFNNPRFPMTFTSANYVPDTKLTARIKPDLSTEGSGQYMEVYAGGPTVLDNKHIHMAGANADTNLFLGTDNNFVSTKEAGLSPAQVNLKSENDITVSDTNLRMTRGNTWVSVYGDGDNRDWRNYTQDLSWDLIETDDQGNYYVGGESHWGPEAMVAKYGPDGDLIWKKIVNSQNTSGWNVQGAAYNPTDKEVAFAVETGINRSHDYAKVSVFDSETGDFKRTFDIYDPDGSMYVRAMTWHPTLGYMAVGNTNGEIGSTGNIRTAYESVVNLTTAPGESPQDELWVNDIGTVPSVGDYFEYQTNTWTVVGVNTYSGYYGLVTNTNTNFGTPAQGGAPVVLHHNSKSTTGIIELPRTSVKIGGNWPEGWSTWRISGTGITGSQTIQNGIGLYQNLPLTNVTGAGSGMTVTIRVDYQGNYYEFYTQGTTGIDYQNGDQVKISGSLLGGVDGGSNYGATVVSMSQDGSNAFAYFSKASYPDLSDQLNACSWTAQFNTSTYTVLSCVLDGLNWKVSLQDCSDLTPASILFYTANGNDLLATVSDNSNIYALAGTPSQTADFRIDMGYQMGYGSTDFTGGTFTITTQLSNRAFVWCNSWGKIFNAQNGSSSYAHSMAVDKVWGDVVVGGYENGAGKNFVWKLDNTGATQWVKRITNDSDNVIGVAVSSVNRSVYFTTSYDSVNKLDMSGNFVKRIQPQGMWGYNNPIVKLEQSLDGEEYLYVGAGYGAIWTNGNGFMVSKFNTNLDIIWTRSIRNNNRSLDTHYDSFHNNFVLGRDRVVLAGYTYLGSFNYYNAFLASITTSDNFDTVQIGDWYLDVLANDVWYSNETSNYAVEDCLDNGATTANSTLQLDTNPGDLDFTNWTWKSAPAKLDTNSNGIVGVESIAFAEGGVLDHNPSDIPPVLTDFDAGNGWNHTLQLSDRGKFIMNGRGVESHTGNLYIHVPSNWNVTFPVGSVITLINVSDVNSSGNRIYVQPENYYSDDCPRIYATGFGTTWSTWSFQGVQTATLMKIGSNEWLLTANNIQNED